MQIDDVVEADFKNTPIGVLPVEWEVLRLERVLSSTVSGEWGDEENDEVSSLTECLILRGTDFPAAYFGLLPNAPRRFIKPSKVVNKQLATGDILIEISGGSKDQPTGRILLIREALIQNADSPLLFTNFVKQLRLHNKGIDAEYFSRYWQYLYNLGKTAIYEKHTTGIRNFKYQDFLLNEYIALPPLPEQRRIAAVLNAIQDEMAVQDDIIAEARELKRSLMQRLFTYGAGAEPAETKETEIGEIPAHWELVRLGEYVDSYRNGFGRRPEPDEQGAIVLRLADVSSGRIDVTNPRYGNMSQDELEKYRVQQGDLLFIRVNGSRHYIGLSISVDISRDDLAFNDHLIRVRLKPGLDNKYVNIATNLPYAREHMVGSTTTSAGQLTINQTVLENFLLPMPPINEREKIVFLVRRTDEKIAAEEDRKTALQDFFRSMLHQLMTGQIRLSAETPLMEKSL